ncbi:MAG TPA: ADP-heptose--LPS heptosyltransferase, partial [Alphaproteobacteria bacterium]|nr:ADP-heptose--LPS heptosyltransferase [Alphaproteobacteria bacterium]
MTQARILVIKHGALGDLIQGFDAYAGLRAGHPDAHIALLTSPPYSGIAGRMPWFDEVIIDQRATPLNLAQSLRLRSVFRARWNMVVDLQCSRRTARYHRFLAAAG